MGPAVHVAAVLADYQSEVFVGLRLFCTMWAMLQRQQSHVLGLANRLRHVQSGCTHPHPSHNK